MLERVAFSFDPNRCTGCQACELACTIENGLLGLSWRQVSTFNAARHPEAPVIHLSMACNHCADAPCKEHCPALAYTQDEATGSVTLHADRCIGCRYCSWACPYDAPKFDAPAGVMTKCTFCSHRQQQGLEPACVTQCPTGALGFGELEALDGVVTPEGGKRDNVPEGGKRDNVPKGGKRDNVPEGGKWKRAMVGMPNTEPGPSIRFTPWHGGQPEPAGHDAANATPVYQPESKISLRSEWPLWAFTLIGAALVASVVASAAGALELPLPAFLAAAVASMALSSLHLGQKLRAWRAMLNLRRSWLSREIVFYSGFVGLATVHLLLPDFRALAVAAAAVGFAALFAMDRVYDLVLRHEPLRSHSADVLLTGLLWTALLIGQWRMAALLAAAKLALYLGRKLRFARRRWPTRPGWSGLRLSAGFALPCVLAVADPGHWPLWALAGTAVGELVDRGELYSELRVPTPRGQMATSLERLLAGGDLV